MAVGGGIDLEMDRWRATASCDFLVWDSARVGIVGTPVSLENRWDPADDSLRPGA